MSTSHSERGRRVRGACPHDCPDTCALEYQVEPGRLIAVRGAKAHRITAGVLCTKVASYPLRTHHPSRVLHPLRRLGPKGAVKPEWQRVSWDEALTDIAQRLCRISEEHGAEAILPYSYAGNMGLIQNASMDRRFFHALGASRLDRTICASAGAEALNFTLGTRLGMDIEAFAEAELILLWGTNPITSNLHLWSRCQEAKRKGAILIAIDPYRSLSAEKCQHWLPIRPGTDAALALAMMHVLIRDDRLDHDYIERHTLGFEQLRDRVADWTPTKAAAICGLEEERIEWLAGLYGRTKKAAIRLNYGLQRHGGGGMAVRAIACLPALTGAWRSPAGGLLLSTSGAYPIDSAYLERPDLMPRHADGSLPRLINMTALGDALDPHRVPASALTGPGSQKPVRALIVYNANPAAVAPDGNKVLAGLAREDLFTVVHDLFVTDTARYADYLLPATSQPEHADIHRSYGHYDVLINHPAMAPLGESLPNTEFFRRLAAKMGFDHPALQEDDDSLMRHALDFSHPTLRHTSFDELSEQGWVSLALPRIDGYVAPFAEGGFPTPSGRCEFFSSRLAELGLDPLPNYTPPHELAPEHPDAVRLPLALISPPERNFLNSSFANIPELAAVHGPPRLRMHPQDAAQRGLLDGQRVCVRNDRGQMRLQLVVTDGTRPGVVTLLWGHWRNHPEAEGHVNDLTSQALADYAGGATFYDCRVEVEATRDG